MKSSKEYESLINSKETPYKKLNWAKYTDFKSRNTRSDLAKRCSKFSGSELIEIFSTKDKTGLLPIHWASINNRFDLIEFMIDKGSPMRVNCSNELFSCGTELHLAAMNGSIQAASILLKKYQQRFQQQNQTKPKQLLLNDSNGITNTSEIQSIKGSNPPDNDKDSDNNNNNNLYLIESWLNDERDSDGQTVLMRSAPPRSKRLDTVRELLRKNLWSIGGRPAEMALFLINKGANWRLVDSQYGMNLFHLAIINDYDDIVSMLLIIDRDLLKIPIQISVTKNSNSNINKTFKELKLEDEKRQEKVVKQSKNLYKTFDELKKAEQEDNIRNQPGTDLESIDLNSNPSPSSNSSSSSIVSTTSASPSRASSPDSSDSDNKKPLISNTERANQLLESGLMPLQLAIVYGRLIIISILWEATYLSSEEYSHHSIDGRKVFDKKKMNKLERRIENDKKLKVILFKAFWSNIGEVSYFIRKSTIKLILLLDISLILLHWIPLYLNWKSSIFLFSFCLTIFLVFKVIFKNPGYLRKSSLQYLNELSKLIGDNKTFSDRNRIKTVIKSLNVQKETINTIDVDADDNVEERVRLLCHRCRCVRKLRSRHCNYCQHCIKDFDHHCIYLGCCIGRYNRLDFLILMILITITSTYGTYIYIYSIDQMSYSGIWRKEFWPFVGLLSIVKYAFIGLVSSFCILRRASLGITMYEEIRSKRIINIFGSDGPPVEVSKFIQMYSTKKDNLNSFWRFKPNRFLSGDLPFKKILFNLREFSNFITPFDYLMTILCADSPLSKPSSNSKINLYKFL